MGSVDGSYELLGGRFIRKQLRVLARQAEGARVVKDIECVHQVRVASRRLRSALRMFRDCFPRRKQRIWRREISRLTRALGVARDCDVQIEFVREFLAGVSDRACRPGVRRLLLRLRQQRQAVQPRVVKSLDRLEESAVLADMQAVIKASLSRLKDRKVTLQSRLVFLRAERMILRKLEKLLAIQDCLSDPADMPRHHEMRILAKRLRYTLEICRPVYEGEVDESVAAVKDLQGLLGDIHDCDVWVEQLPVFLEAERVRTVEYFGQAGPFSRLRPGIELLQDERRRRREEAFVELVDRWHQLCDHGLWDRLAGTVLSYVRGMPGSERPGRAEAGAEQADAAPPADAPAADAPPADEPADGPAEERVDEVVAEPPCEPQGDAEPTEPIEPDRAEPVAD